MKTMDLALLRSFVAISQSGSITAASRLVGRTQSAVSVQMQRLSDTVGQPLLHRNAHGVQLTSAGEKLLVHARRILNTHDEAIADLSGRAVTGSITFGCPEDYLTAFLPGFLKLFGAEFPGIEIRIVCAPTVELQPLLKNRQIEIALVSRLETSGEHDIIRFEPLVWVADSDTPDILANKVVPLALSAPDALDNRVACRAMEQSGRNYRISFASNSLAALLAIARSGQAISVVTQTAVPCDLHVIRDGLPELPKVGVALVFPTGSQSAAVKVFGERLHTHVFESSLSAI